MYRKKPIKIPICAWGDRAYPREDCGSISGYYNVLKVISGPQNDNYDSIKTWVGENWHPEKFNKNKVKFDNICFFTDLVYYILISLPKGTHY